MQRDSQREQKIKEKFQFSVRHCIVAAIELPVDSLVDSTVRAEVVAWFAAKEVVEVLPNGGAVGLTGGTNIARFVDLIPHDSSKLGGITWLPLLTPKPTSAISPISANSLIARLVYNQPNSKGYNLPFISPIRRTKDYLNQAHVDERKVLEFASSLLERAKHVEDALISVGSPYYDVHPTDVHLVTPELMDIYKRLSPEERQNCVGDVLLYLIDNEGRQLDNQMVLDANNDLVYSIGLEALRNISKRGSVWLLAGSETKAPAIFAALKAGFANCLVLDPSTADALLKV